MVRPSEWLFTVTGTQNRFISRFAVLKIIASVVNIFISLNFFVLVYMATNSKTDQELSEELFKGWSRLSIEKVLGEDPAKKADYSRRTLGFLNYMETLQW